MERRQTAKAKRNDDDDNGDCDDDGAVVEIIEEKRDLKIRMKWDWRKSSMNFITTPIRTHTYHTYIYRCITHIESRSHTHTRTPTRSDRVVYVEHWIDFYFRFSWTKWMSERKKETRSENRIYFKKKNRYTEQGMMKTETETQMKTEKKKITPSCWRLSFSE